MERGRQRLILRLLATLMALAMWVPALAKACPSGLATDDACCCCEDGDGGPAAGRDREMSCCETAATSGPVVPALTGDPPLHVATAPVSAHADVPLPPARTVGDAGCRGPPDGAPPLYKLTCSYRL